MVLGIRATVKFSAPEGCPIADISKIADSTVDQVSTSVSTPDSKGSVTEYLVDVSNTSNDIEREAIFSYGASKLYRLTHVGENPCPCECLGLYGCPVHRYVAKNGDVTLIFHAESFEQLQNVMADLQDRFQSVDVQRLLQPPIETAPNEQMFVNRGKLTNRQLEVLQTAYESGYFERPKRANATEIASELGISQSTFTEHLVTAQRKILDDIL